MSNTNKSKARCEFCDSTSHKQQQCNSSFGGKRKYLRSIMNTTECPEFSKLSTLELRYIASRETYEKVILEDQRYMFYEDRTRIIQVPIDRLSFNADICCNHHCCNHNYRDVFSCLKRGTKYKKSFRYNPIPWENLSRKRLLNALRERWEKLRDVVLKQNCPPTVELDDCPICYEAISQLKWCTNRSEWKIHSSCVITSCRHKICKPCWGKYTKHSYNGSYRVTCPMCRTDNYTDQVEELFSNRLAVP